MEKWPILDQNHGLTPLEICQFFDFLNFLFLYPRNAFFCSRISSQTFSWSILPKIKSWKNGHFRTQTMGLPLLKNVNFSTVWTSAFYSLERRFFVLKYRKGHFPALYCLKKKFGKMAIFGPKPWVNPVRKMSIFLLFQLLVFIPWKNIFSF